MKKYSKTYEDFIKWYKTIKSQTLSSKQLEYINSIFDQEQEQDIKLLSCGKIEASHYLNKFLDEECEND